MGYSGTVAYNGIWSGKDTVGVSTGIFWYDNGQELYLRSAKISLGLSNAIIYFSSTSQFANKAALVFGWTSTDGLGTIDAALARSAAGKLEVNNGTAGTFRDLKLRSLISSGGFVATDAAAPTIASASTIAPAKQVSFVSGTTTISTITAPSPISAGGGQITLIPTGLWSTDTAGNIALATTAVVSKALILTYDTTTGKWYPSY
jgi:hypothetical protein